MHVLLILAVFANLNGQVFGKDVFEIGVLFEAGCAGARVYIVGSRGASQLGGIF